MVDGSVVPRLAQALPEDWEGLIERHVAVAAIRAMDKPGVAEIDRLAANLNISRRHFYRLLKEHERSNGHAYTALTGGRPTSAPAHHDAIIAVAQEELGPGALMRDIKLVTTQISEAMGVAAPSAFVVRQRTRKPRLRVEIGSRLGEQVDWLVDVCGLDLILGSSDSARSASLLLLIHVPSGTVTQFRLQQGSTTTAALLDMLTAGSLGTDPQGEVAHLWMTKRLGAHAEVIRGALNDQEILVRECPAHTIRSGEAALMIFGQRLGRLSLRPRPWKAHKRLPIVSTELAQCVIEFLIAQRNNQLSSARAKPRHCRFKNLQTRESAADPALA